MLRKTVPKEVSLKAAAEDSQWECRCNMLQQTVPNTGTGDGESSITDECCGQWVTAKHRHCLETRIITGCNTDIEYGLPLPLPLSLLGSLLMWTFWLHVVSLFCLSCQWLHCELDWEQSFIWWWGESFRLFERSILELLKQVGHSSVLYLLYGDDANYSTWWNVAVTCMS